LRCREGDKLRIRFVNGSAHPHTVHFHGLHPSAMDGVPGQGAGIINPGKSTVYEFDAEPFGLHLYHCHVAPLAEHIARGMYGTFIVDPKQGRPDADEMVMVQHGYNTTFDGEGNQFYAVNGIPFHYMAEPIEVNRDDPVRIYLVNALEYDPINSFHIHGNFFDYYPTGTRLEPTEFTDTVIQGQAQRGICEMTFPNPGPFMFHAHKTEFAELGWMGFFDVS
jgi:FtsP/CotA-like multicopper oxidase with cupredoxin domain